MNPAKQPVSAVQRNSGTPIATHQSLSKPVGKPVDAVRSDDCRGKEMIADPVDFVECQRDFEFTHEHPPRRPVGFFGLRASQNPACPINLEVVSLVRNSQNDGGPGFERFIRIEGNAPHADIDHAAAKLAGPEHPERPFRREATSGTAAEDDVGVSLPARIAATFVA